jgi:hypothetical protein
MKRANRWRAALLLAASLTFVGQATTAAIAGPNGIVSSDEAFFADGTWNGLRVYLSSPRHSNSGSRGECFNPGREENFNGRRFNWYAADGNYYNGTYTSTDPYRNLSSRGYYVVVSKNPHDDDYAENRQRSWAIGADLHVVTHSNAVTGGCENATNRLETLWEHSNDNSLASAIGSDLNVAAPDGWSHYQRTNLLELETNAPYGDAYVEIAFHSHQDAQSWIYYDSHKTGSWRYGLAIDKLLGYP